MSDLRLKILGDGPADAGPGVYSDAKALDVFKRYLETKISVDDAAREIASMLPRIDERKSRMTEVGWFHSFLLQMAEQIPYSHQAQTRLVQLIQRVSRSEKLNEKVDLEGYSIIYSMGDFDSQLRESFPPSYIVDDPEDPDSFSHGLNLSAFYARLMQCGRLSYSPFPLWEMRDALEKEYRPGLNFNISSAALWIIFAGQAIYTQVVEAPVPLTTSIKTGSLYEGPEFGLPRWRFWKESLVAAGGEKEADEESRRLAYRAAELMQTIEQSMAF